MTRVASPEDGVQVETAVEAFQHRGARRLRGHRQRAQLTEAQLVQQQRQMAVTRDEMRALARQLRELRMQQQALETLRASPGLNDRLKQK